MSKREKRLAKLGGESSQSVRADQVETMMRDIFGSRFELGEGTSHMLRGSHPALFGHPYFVGGMLSIPIKGGQDVKPFYLKRLEEANRIIKAFEQAEQEKAKESEKAEESKNEKDS